MEKWAKNHNIILKHHPKELDVECCCLESPKSTVRNGYYYNTVAEWQACNLSNRNIINKI